MRTFLPVGLCLAAALAQAAFGQSSDRAKPPAPAPKPLTQGALIYSFPAEAKHKQPAAADSCSSLKKKIEHLRKAAEHLQAAGLNEQAEQIRQQARQQELAWHQQRLEQKLAELEAVQAEVNRLRQLTGQASQVLVHVQVIEVATSKLHRLGVGFEFPKPGGSLPDGVVPVAGTAGEQNGPQGAAFTRIVEDEQALDQEIKALHRDKQLRILSRPQVRTFSGSPGTIRLMHDATTFEKLIEALRREKLAKVLSDSSLITTAGRPASLHSGGAFPIPNPDKPADGAGVEWRGFGIGLEVCPVVLGEGRVRLELAPEIITPDFKHAVTIDGKQVPGLTTRRINTQVELEAGRTLVLGGLTAHRGQGEAVQTLILVRCDLIDAHPAPLPPAEPNPGVE